MVCAKCEAAEKAKKPTTLACTDVWIKDSTQRNERKIGGNKLLEARKRYTAPVPVAGSALKKAGSTSVGSTKRGAGGTASSSSLQDGLFGKCKVCKVTVAKEGAKYCQKCAFKEGKCVMCEAKILDTTGYKMSAK